MFPTGCLQLSEPLTDDEIEQIEQQKEWGKRLADLQDTGTIPITFTQTTQTELNYNQEIMDKLKHFETIILQVINTNMEIREDIAYINKTMEDNQSSYIKDARDSIERENQMLTRIANLEKSIDST